MTRRPVMAEPWGWLRIKCIYIIWVNLEDNLNNICARPTLALAKELFIVDKYISCRWAISGPLRASWASGVIVLAKRKGCRCCLLIKISFFVAVMVVNAYQRAAKSEDLAEGDKHRVVNFAHRLCDEPACEQCAPESAHCYRYYELDFSHCVLG